MNDRDLHVISIGSSSSGNSYLIKSDRTSLILDVGLSAKAIKSAIRSAGVTEETIQGILVTHEHVDHIKSIRAMSRACSEAEIVTSYGTASACPNFGYVPEERLKIVAAQDEFAIGDIRIKAFSLSHDAAEPVSYSFQCGDTRLAVVTDTGIVTDEIREEILTADMLVLEANHEIGLLEMGPYPYPVKKRILSDHGHLSNAAAGAALTEALEARLSRCGGLTRTERMIQELLPDAAGASGLDVMLAHLSTTNNTPDNAGITVRHIVGSCGFSEDAGWYSLLIAAKSTPTVL